MRHTWTDFHGDQVSEGSIVNIVTAIVTLGLATIAYLTLLAKLRYGVLQAETAATKAKVVEAKIDNNTLITKQGTSAAAVAATKAATKADEVVKQMNGAMDERIQRIVRQEVREALADFQATTKGAS